MTCTYTDLPKLGFGFMRLPEVEGADGAKEIDLGALCDMVDTFMDAGFTYFDTARGYHGGRSEAALREALVKRYPRASFQVATKLPAWLAKDAGEARTMFETSLEQTGAGYFDFYLLHNLGEERTRLFEDWGLWEFLAEKKAAGLIRNLGFSMHDKATRSRTCWQRTPRWISCSCRSTTRTGRARPSSRALVTRLRAPTGCPSW